MPTGKRWKKKKKTEGKLQDKKYTWVSSAEHTSEGGEPGQEDGKKEEEEEGALRRRRADGMGFEGHSR